MQVVRDFWNRRPVKGVGLAIKLNWDGRSSSDPYLKEIRNEAVSFYTGIGTATSDDGVFSKEEKWAANHASELN